MDGVLISSIGSVRRCWRRWAKMYGVPNAEHVRGAAWDARDRYCEVLRPDIDAQEGLRVIEDMEIEDISGLQVLPGVKTAAGKPCRRSGGRS